MHVCVVLRTFVVSAPTAIGDNIPGTVAIVLDIPNIIPAYLQHKKDFWVIRVEVTQVLFVAAMW